jgi:hypothetical protein
MRLAPLILKMSYKTFAFVALLVVAVCLSVTLGVRQTSVRNLSLESPSKVFSVQMNERISNDGSHDLVLNVTKQRQPFLQDLVYYHGTSLDGSFLRRYPQRDWVSESILRFGRETLTDQGDDLIVANESASQVRFLTINDPAESFLILDLEPGARLSLNIASQTDATADISGFSCLATLMDGTVRKGSANFNVRGRYKGTAHYTVAITSAEVAVRSVEFDKAQ